MPAVSTQLNDFILPYAPRPTAEPSKGPSWLARVSQAFLDARMRQAEREVARLISQNGDRLTDDLERKIERYYL
jgi:hypothetical protein